LAKRVLAYLQGTLDHGIRFTQEGSPVLVNVSFPTKDGVYTNANWGPQDDQAIQQVRPRLSPSRRFNHSCNVRELEVWVYVQQQYSTFCTNCKAWLNVAISVWPRSILLLFALKALIKNSISMKSFAYIELQKTPNNGVDLSNPL
jgi:hypothetical protein